MTVLSWVLHREVVECSDVSKECTASIFRVDSVSMKMQSAAVKTSKFMPCKMQKCSIANRKQNRCVHSWTYCLAAHRLLFVGRGTDS